MNRILTTAVICLLSCAALSAQTRGSLSYAYADGVEAKHSYVAVSTNVLYDAVLVPNLGLEFNIYDNWTLSVNGMWSWWTVPTADWYWRVYGGEATVKKYFGKASEVRSMTGHHAGIYGQVISYDLSVGHFGRMSPKLSIGGGVEYGYSFPVSNALNIDVSVGVGYLGGRYYDYVENKGHYVWRATVDQKWFGPTKAAVSLVWLIGTNRLR